MLAAALIDQFPASHGREDDLQKEKSLAGQVPRFYFQKPAASSVALYLHKACHQLKETDVLTPEDLKAVKNAICGVCAQRDAVSVVNLEDAYLSASDVEQTRNPRVLTQVRRDVQARLGSRFAEFLRASAILRHHFHNGKCSGNTLFTTTVAANNRLKMIITLFRNDVDGDGCLTEEQITTALTEIAEQRQLAIPASMKGLWQVFATKRLMFPFAKRGLVPIIKIAEEPAMHLLATYSEEENSDVEWFSIQKTHDVHCKFVELDDDGDGLLTQEALACVRPTDEGVSSMVPYFVQRVFERHVHQCSPLTNEPGMALSEFVEFLMAWNHRGQPHSTRYFFNALDVENLGYLTARVVEMWCVHVKQLASDQLGWVAEYNPLDLKDEIFDIIKPRCPGRITLQDVIEQTTNEKKVTDVCGLLIDAACLTEYEQRESM